MNAPVTPQGIMGRIFGGAQQPQQAAAQAPSQFQHPAHSANPGTTTPMDMELRGQTPESLQQQTQPGKTQPGGTSDKPAQDGKSPLDNFAEFFNITPEAQKQQAPGIFDSPLVPFDATKMQEALAGYNPMQGLDQALVQRATSGDMQAFGEVLNGFGRTIMQQMAQLSHSMYTHGMKEYHTRAEPHSRQSFQDFATDQAIASMVPNYDHPAVAPMIKSLRQQFKSAKPDATPQQIATALKNYLTQFAGNFVEKGDPQQQQNSGGNGAPQRAPMPTDWEAKLFG